MNMNINVGDKFVVAKKQWWFIDEGTQVVVTHVDNHNVSFVFGEDGKSNGYMDIATFEAYFEKVVDETEDEPFYEITEEYIASIMDKSEFEVYTTFNKCTIVSCRLPNGFVITESSACVNPESYDAETGFNICLDKIAGKIWELEAYMLQEQLYRANATECPCGCESCNECPEC